LSISNAHDSGSRRGYGERLLAAAVSASANVIVSYDRDLVALEKPFGIPLL
jgi:predicted nucleic acid-binding protein